MMVPRLIGARPGRAGRCSRSTTNSRISLCGEDSPPLVSPLGSPYFCPSLPK
ncbi:unnamed protein product [Gulo gulo]|uniref:Uncharacterized protein n=1 Tax=Gulo gulo TaxID=48420 RepID=A0A9X9Q624_GULGU|nr:unnamed protein product [Gulo gulo]